MGTEKKQINNWFDWVQLAVLVVLAPLFVFPKPQFWWVFLIIPLLLIGRILFKKQFWQKTPLDLPLLIIFAAIAVSYFKSTDISHSLPKIAGLLFGILLFYAAVALLKSEKLLKWGVAIFLAGGFIFSIIGLLGMPTFKVKHLDFLMKIKDMIPRIDFNLPGAEAGFSTNAIGGSLLLLIPLFFVLLLLTWNRKTRQEAPYGPFSSFLLTGGLLITGSVLLLTQSRGAWGGAFIATIIIGLIFLFQKITSKKIIIITIIALLLVIIVAAVGINSLSHAQQLKPGMKQVQGTLQFRIHVWNITIPVIRENPLWGVGLNNFRTVPEVRFFWSSTHNQLLHVATELGIPALIAYLSLLIIAGFMCIEIFKKSPILWLRCAALGLGWGQLAFLFFGLTDAIPPGAKVGIFFWLSLTLITAIFRFIMLQPIAKETLK
jgi:O-antigen ligase